MVLKISICVFILLIYLTIFALCKVAGLEDEYYEKIGYMNMKK